MTDKPRIVLIDLSALFRAAWHANENGDVSVAFSATIDAVRRIRGMYEGGRVAICCDGKTNWRKKVAPSYKANREQQPASLYHELDRTKERLRADGYLLWECDGYEADDVMATATDAATATNHDVVIATHDKDALQLVRSNVKVLRTHTWVEVGAKEVEEKFGVEPFKLAGWQALVGDKSDNVAGAPGIGDVKATALIRKYHGITQLFQAVERDPDEVMKTPCGKGALGPAAVLSLQQSRAQVELALTLVTPKYDAPIKFEDIFTDREVAAPKEGMIPMEEPETETAVETDEAPAEPSTDKTTAPTVTTALATVVAPPSSFERQLEPTSSAGLMALANVLFQSRMYPKLGSAHAIAAVVARGRSLGLNAGTALDCIHWLEKEGKMALHAHLIAALAESHPDCEYLMPLESTETFAEVETKNRKHPKPVRHRYTIEDAVAAGIATLDPAVKSAKPGEKDSRGNWDKRRKEMLRKTAMVQLCRMVYPSAALGLYSLEEMGVE